MSTAITAIKSGIGAAATTPTAALPAQAVSQEADLVAPAQALLQGLYLLGSKDEMTQADGGASLWQGSPQSVAVIEAGATALTKWWAAGLGAFVIATWGSIRIWWGSIEAADQQVVLWAAAVTMAAAILALGYVIGSDVRSRAAASVATINARRDIATTVANLSKTLYSSTPTPPTAQLLTLPSPLNATNNHADCVGEESGWKAIAIKTNGSESVEYLLVKGKKSVWTSAADCTFA